MNTKKVIHKHIFVPSILLGFSIVSGLILSSSPVSADNDSAVDEVSITVPISCTMSGSGMTSHNASIANGTYNSNIGETTMTAFCNDNSGFAIYAIGYTDDTDGKNVLTDSVDANNDIATGTATAPVGGNDTSNWAMKLSTITSPTPTYPITIQNSFDSFHDVPDDYALVAKRTQATDVGQQAEGSTIKSTYQAYISKTQPSGTYTGQVKYVMVHPSTELPPVDDNQIGVVYDGNGLFFDQAGTRSTNRVVYQESCEDEYGYIADTPFIMKTRNLNVDGTQNGPYNTNETWYEGDGLDPNRIELGDAPKVKIVINYSLTQETVYAFNVAVNSNSIDNLNYDLYDDSINRSGTITYVSDAGDDSEVYIYSEIGNNPTVTNYDYGIYVQIYPVYDEPTEGTTYGVVQNVCSYHPITGAYTETVNWNGGWYVATNDGPHWLYQENPPEYDNDDYYSYSVAGYIKNNKESLSGETITIYAYNPYEITYDGNGATAGAMNGFTTNMPSDVSTADLMAHNFYKTGYGFAGWSEDNNATVNSNSKIYGPNETVPYSDLSFDNNRSTTLYAVWVPTSGNMQNFSCSSLSNGQVTALTDTRDNNVYTVGKMQDGQCWMMENLRLDATNSTDSSKAQGFAGVFDGLADSENVFGGTGANSRYSTSNISGGTSQYQKYRFPRYNNNNTRMSDSNLAAASGGYNDDGPQGWNDMEGIQGNNYKWYGYGNYYTWAAAIADTTEYTNLHNITNTSICPTGWRLPSAETGSALQPGLGDYSNLYDQMGGDVYYNLSTVEASNMFRSFPNNFVLSGRWVDNLAIARGVAGQYISRTSNSYYDYMSFFVTRDYIYLHNTGTSRSSGSSIRCISE